MATRTVLIAPTSAAVIAGAAGVRHPTRITAGLAVT
jgi:hypothetical protein